MIVIAGAWGSCFVLLDWGMSGHQLLWSMALRAVIAGLALMVVALVSRHRSRTTEPITLRTWGLIGVLAVMNVTVAFGAMAASTTGVTTGVASVLANAQPLLVVLPAWAMFGERPRFTEIAGVAIGFGGLVLVAVPSGFGSGAGLALLAAAGITVGALLARRLCGVDVLVLGAWQFLLGGALLVIAAAVSEGAPVVAWSARFVIALATLALVSTALPYVLWFTELRRASLTAVTSWTLLVPVVGVALGVVVLGEQLTVAQIAGAAAVVVALAVVARAGRRTLTTAAPAGDIEPSETNPPTLDMSSSHFHERNAGHG